MEFCSASRSSFVAIVVLLPAPLLSGEDSHTESVQCSTTATGALIRPSTSRMASLRPIS